eukprot:2623004-Rhodomonas_salina.1
MQAIGIAEDQNIPSTLRLCYRQHSLICVLVLHALSRSHGAYNTSNTCQCKAPNVQIRGCLNLISGSRPGTLFHSRCPFGKEDLGRGANALTDVMRCTQSGMSPRPRFDRVFGTDGTMTRHAVIMFTAALSVSGAFSTKTAGDVVIQMSVIQ